MERGMPGEARVLSADGEAAVRLIDLTHPRLPHTVLRTAATR
ncbi:hypothetical protein ACFOY4_37500 [Actinomadura syzygii]|nr:hypothetical protein [Actinomadura syzygii]